MAFLGVQTQYVSGYFFLTSQEVDILTFQNFTDVRFCTFSISADTKFQREQNFHGSKIWGVGLGLRRAKKKACLRGKCSVGTQFKKIGPVELRFLISYTFHNFVRDLNIVLSRSKGEVQYDGG